MPIYEEDILPEDIPYPEELDQRFSASSPALPPGTMNASVAEYPRIYATATDNAYTAEQNAAAAMAMNARDRAIRQKMALEAEQAARQFAFGQRFQSLVKSGAAPEEAARYALTELNDPRVVSQALSRLPATHAIPSTLPSVPIIDPETKKIIGQSVYGPSGQLHATHFTNPDALSPQEAAQRQLLKDTITADRSQLNRLQRMKGNIEQRALNPTLDADIAELTKRLEANSSAFTNASRIAPTPAKAPIEKVVDQQKADSIKAAFRAGTITRDDAVAQLKQIGFE